MAQKGAAASLETKCVGEVAQEMPGQRLPGTLDAVNSYRVSVMAATSALCFTRRYALFIFISVVEGSRTGTTVQNSESCGGRTVPEGAFFFCPSRNLSFP